MFRYIALCLVLWSGPQAFCLEAGDENWDSRFHPGPGVVGPAVQAVLVASNQVFVGGSFSWAGNSNIYGVARWDGTNWYALGNGFEAND